MIDIISNISIITLHVNGLNAPIKRLSKWIKKLYVVYPKKPTFNIKIHTD